MTFSIIAVMDGLTKIAMIVCATYAAVYFNSPKMMWFCLMAAFFGHSFERKKEDGEAVQKMD